MIYPMTKTAVRGGLAHGKPDSAFNAKQLHMGSKVELEHTNDRKKAKDVAKDHLVEDPKYYTHLKQMENKHKTAGLAESGMAAIIGMVLGKAARTVPSLEAARIDRPALYDAALSAAVVAAVERMQAGQSGGPLDIQRPTVVSPHHPYIMSPGWNFM